MKDFNPEDHDWLVCTGDVVVGDTIDFTEAVFGGSHRKPKFLGDRQIIAKVIGDSYGAKKQQHTFTLQVKHSEGEQPIGSGKTIRRKGRNVYRNGTHRLRWNDERLRQSVADEKHERGDAARTDRDHRIAEMFCPKCQGD